MFSRHFQERYKMLHAAAAGFARHAIQTCHMFPLFVLLLFSLLLLTFRMMFIGRQEAAF